MSDLLEVVIDIRDAVAKLDEAEHRLAQPVDMFQAIGQALESVTLGNFEAQGRPKWVPLAASTVRARQKRSRGDVFKILVDSGMLRDSLSTEYGPDHVTIGVNRPYAAIHQFGGTIKHPAYSTKVRLRTTAKGGLQRQRGHRNLAVFARDGDERARESWHEVGEYTIEIPARPYLPFRGPPDAAVLQPEAETAVLEEIVTLLQTALG